MKDWGFLGSGNLSRFVSPCEVSEVGRSEDSRSGGRKSSVSDSDLGILVLDSWLLDRSFHSVLAEIERGKAPFWLQVLYEDLRRHSDFGYLCLSSWFFFEGCYWVDQGNCRSPPPQI